MSGIRKISDFFVLICGALGLFRSTPSFLFGTFSNPVKLLFDFVRMLIVIKFLLLSREISNKYKELNMINNLSLRVRILLTSVLIHFRLKLFKFKREIYVDTFFTFLKYLILHAIPF